METTGFFVDIDWLRVFILCYRLNMPDQFKNDEKKKKVCLFVVSPVTSINQLVVCCCWSDPDLYLLPVRFLNYFLTKNGMNWKRTTFDGLDWIGLG